MTIEYKEKLLQIAIKNPCRRKNIIDKVLNECGYSNEYYNFVKELQELENDESGACCGCE